MSKEVLYILLVILGWFLRELFDTFIDLYHHKLKLKEMALMQEFMLELEEKENEEMFYNGGDHDTKENNKTKRS